MVVPRCAVAEISPENEQSARVEELCQGLFLTRGDFWWIEELLSSDQRGRLEIEMHAYPYA
jgi:hypothetical protein